MNIKVCAAPGCTNEVGKRKNKRYCTPSCATRAWRLRNPDKVQGYLRGQYPYYDRVCENPDCGTIFKTVRKDKQYCSKKCVSRHRYILLKNDPKRRQQVKAATKRWIERNPESKKRSQRKWYEKSRGIVSADGTAN